jgi:CelD/BcsL family acetyltransferase involved in cellulose biosynthesis
MRIEWIEDPARFAAARGPWDTLAERHRLPFLRHDWLSAWWEAFGGGRRLRTCCLWDGEELAAAFPLCASGGRFEALADRLHTPVFRPLARDHEALEAVVRTVLNASWSELALNALPAGDPAADLLTGAARMTLVEAQHVSPIVETAGDLEAYRGTLDRSRRKDVERRRRRFAEAHDAVLEIAAPDDVDAALAAAFALEERGWKGRRGTAIGQEEATSRFYDAAARAAHADGRLRIARVADGGTPVAFDLCLLDFDRLWVLKGAYDEEYARYAPGLSLTYREVEWCFEQGLEALELLGDDEPWKRLFANAERRHCSVRAYRLRPAPAGRFAYRRAVRPLLRRAYRSVRPVRRGRG